VARIQIGGLTLRLQRVAAPPKLAIRHFQDFNYAFLNVALISLFLHAGLFSMAWLYPTDTYNLTENFLSTNHAFVRAELAQTTCAPHFLGRPANHPSPAQPRRSIFSKIFLKVQIPRRPSRRGPQKWRPDPVTQSYFWIPLGKMEWDRQWLPRRHRSARRARRHQRQPLPGPRRRRNEHPGNGPGGAGGLFSYGIDLPRRPGGAITGPGTGNGSLAKKRLHSLPPDIDEVIVSDALDRDVIRARIKAHALSANTATSASWSANRGSPASCGSNLSSARRGL